MQISTYLYIFYTAISQTFEPDLYKSIAENDKKKLFKIIIGIVGFVAIPVILFILFAHPIVKILTFGRYTDSTVFAQILAVKNVPMALCFLVSNVIIGYGYPKVELINRTIGAVLSVILFKMMIEKYTFYGAAVTNSIVFVLMTAVSGTFIFYKLIANKRRGNSFHS